MKKIFGTIVFCLIVILIVFALRSENISDKLIRDVEIDEISINDMELDNNTFYYNNLSEIEQKYYRLIGKGIENLDSNITLDITTEGDYNSYKYNIENALEAFFNDHPEVFFVEDKYEISLTNYVAIKVLNVHLTYVTKDKNEIEYMEAKMKKEIDSISSKVANLSSEYEKEVAIHDYIAENTKYYDFEEYEDIPSIKHTAYGALVDKSAVCDGLTKAFQIVLSKNNIESIFVTGIMDNVAHAWCKVNIDNSFYNVDITSDKTLNSEKSHLIVHSYFNVKDEEILNTHTIDKSEILPKCTSDKYNYYVYNDFVIAPIDSFEYKLGHIVKAQEGKPLLEVNISGLTDVPDKLIQSLYNLNFNNYKTNNITKMQYTKINNNYIVVK